MIQVDFTGATPNIDVTPGHPGVTIDVSKRGPAGPRGEQGPGVGETVASIASERGWRALRVALDAGTARVVAMGDSKTEGAGVSVTSDRWLNVLMAGLRARYAPTSDQGLGYLPAYYATFWGFPSAPTTSGSAVTVGNVGGLGNRSRHLAAGGSVTWTVPAWTSGVPLLVHWTQHPGLGDLEVVTGGKVRATIATGGSTIASKVTSVTIPAGTTSITIRHKSGTGAGNAARVEGIVHRTSTTGVIVYDAARSGAKAVDYSEGLGSSGAPDSEDYHWQAVQLIAPHAVILAFGANDQASRTAAQWSDDLRLAVAKAKAAAPGAGVIVLHGAQRTEEAGDPSRVLAFEAAARAAVGADPDVSILYESSLWAPVVGEDYSDGDGIWLSDTVHTNATANQAIARMLLASITSVDGAGSQFGPSLAQLTLVEKGALTNAGTPRPAWPGIVDWWVPVGSPAPPNAIAGDLVTEVSSEDAPWTPSALPLGGWWSAAHPGTAPGGLVTSVPDRSGNGRPAPLETGVVTHAPTSLNGTPALVFDGASRLRTAVHGLSGTGPLTFAWTGKLGSTTPSTVRFFFGGRLAANTASTTQVGSNGSGNYTLRRVATISTTTVAVDTSPHTYVAVFDAGSVSRFYIDGTLVHTGTSAAGSFDHLIIGGSTTTSGGTDSQWHIGPGGMIGDLMWMTGALDNDSPSDFATLQSWLKMRAGMA